METSRNKLNLSSGKQARSFRRALAAMAVGKSQEAIRSIAYPLDVDLPLDYWDTIRAAYNVSSGTVEGSLDFYIFTMFSNGFRMFPTKSQRMAYQMSGIFGDDAFAAEWDAAMEGKGIKASSIKPSDLFVFFSKRPRTTARRTVVDETDAGFIAEDFMKLLGGKDDHLRMLSEDVAANMVAAFPQWADMNKGLVQCGAVLDKTLAAHGYAFPSLEQAFAKADALPACTDAYESSTLAFDDELPQGVIDHAFMPHLVCAITLADHERHGAQGKPSDHIKNSVITPNATGLSWVLGKGISYFANTLVSDIASDMNVPADRMASIEAVKDAAMKIPANVMFDQNVYPIMRTQIAGRLGSWIENYTKRLFSLEKAVDAVEPYVLPNLKAEPYNAALNFGLDAESMATLHSNLYGAMDAAKASIKSLAGKGSVPTISDINAVDALTEVIEAFAGAIGSLNESLTKAGQDDARINLPAWAYGMERLNRYSGGIRDYEQELLDASETLSATIAARNEHFIRLVKHVGFNAMAERAIENLGSRPAKGGGTAMISGKRNALHRFLRVGREALDPILFLAVKRWAQSLEVTSKKNINKFMDRKQGQFWMSEHARSRHNVYLMDYKALGALDVMQSMRQLLDKLDVEFPNHIEVEALRNAYIGILLAGLPATVPHDLAQPADSIRSSLRLGASLDIELGRDEVRCGAVASMFARGYSSLIKGKLAQLKRTGFTINAGFGAYDKSVLAYVPKDVSWNVPAALSKHWHVLFGSALKPGAVIAAEIAKTVIVTIRNESCSDEQIAAGRHLLRQIPHDWYAATGLVGVGDVVQGSLANADEIGSMRSIRNALRIVGPSSLKAPLDDSLNKGVKLNYPKVLFRLQVAMRKNEDGRAETSPVGIRAELHQPVTEGLPDGEIGSLPNIMGIDLGMYGVGYSVMSIESGEVVDEGYIPTRRPRLLVEGVSKYRKRAQPKQRYGAVMDTPLAEAREQAAAEVLSLIDGLIEKYQAHPIVEANFGNVRSGSGAQLATVFDSIIRYYTFSSVDAHVAARKSHWQGADRWVHEGFASPKKTGRKKALSVNLNKDALELQPLSMFPGSAIGSYGTTTRCSCCGRNPVELGKLAEDGGHSDSNGIVSLPGGSTIRLAINGEPLADRAFDGKALIRAIRDCLLRPSGDSKKLSRKSSYRCLFTDCGEVSNSDVNSARNIVWKWLEKQAGLSQKLANWDSLGEQDRLDLLAQITGKQESGQEA